MTKMDRNWIVCTIYYEVMTISNKSSISGPIPGWAVSDVGLTSTNYRTCITLMYTNYTSSGLILKLH